MKAKIAISLLVAATVWAGALWAQQARIVAPKDKPAAKAAAVRKAQEEPRRGADGDAAYKANCARCHAAPQKFSERQTATIMQHMRVRANLTEEETTAILNYLTR